jgi:hypothetical protein
MEYLSIALLEVTLPSVVMFGVILLPTGRPLDAYDVLLLLSTESGPHIVTYPHESNRTHKTRH